MLNNSKIIQQPKRQIKKSRTAPVLNSFESTAERTIENSAVILQYEVEQCSRSGFQDKYIIPENVPDTSDQYMAKLHKLSPLRLQLLLELLGDNLYIREKMLPQEPVEVSDMTGVRETIPHD